MAALPSGDGQPSLSQLSGFHQAKRRSHENTGMMRPSGIAPLPPKKSIKTEVFSSPSGGAHVKVEAPLSYDEIKREALGKSSEQKLFTPMQMPFMEAGCGSTL